MALYICLFFCAVFFGLWMNSLNAGFFMFYAILVLYEFLEKYLNK